MINPLNIKISDLFSFFPECETYKQVQRKSYKIREACGLEKDEPISYQNMSDFLNLSVESILYHIGQKNPNLTDTILYNIKLRNLESGFVVSTDN